MTYRATAAAVILGLFFTVPAAAAEFAVPSCEDLLAWANRHDESASWTMNAKTSMSNIFAPEVSEAVFGVPVVDWGRKDIKELNRSIANCSKQARRAKDKAATAALNNARTMLSRQVNGPITRLERARPEIAKQAEMLLGLPGTADVYHALGEIRGPDGAPPNLRALGRSNGPEVRPMRMLVRQLQYLPDAEYRDLADHFAAHREEIRTEYVDTLVENLSDVPATNEGLLEIRERLYQAQQDFGADLTPEQEQAIDQAAESRRSEIETALAGGTASAGAVADAGGGIALPACEDLLRWAAKTDWNQTRNMPSGYVPAVVLDEEMVPLFGKSLRDWSENDFANYGRLKDHCFTVAKSAPKGSELNTLFNGPGRYANDLGIKMPQFQAPLGEYYALHDALQGAEEKIAAAPESPEGLQALTRVMADPALRAADYRERARLQQQVQARHQQIAAAVLKPDIDKMAEFEATLDNLKTLPAYRQEVMARHSAYLTRDELARFDAAYGLYQARLANKARPEFETFLANVPADAEGLKQIEAELSALHGGARQAGQLAPYDARARARAQEIKQEMAEARCDDLLAGMELSSTDAAREVFGPGKTAPLRAVLCALDTAGHKVHSFEPVDDPEDAFALKITPQGGVFQTITLHEAEVGPDQRALVGLSVADANVERTLSVQEWQGYLDALLGGVAPVISAHQGGAGAAVGPGDTGGSLDAKLQECRAFVQALDAQGKNPDDLTQNEQATLMVCMFQFGPMIASQAIEDGSCDRLLNTPESQLSEDERMEALSCTMHKMMQETGQLQ